MHADWSNAGNASICLIMGQYGGDFLKYFRPGPIAILIQRIHK